MKPEPDRNESHHKHFVELLSESSSQMRLHRVNHLMLPVATFLLRSILNKVVPHQQVQLIGTVEHG